MYELGKINYQTLGIILIKNINIIMVTKKWFLTNIQ